MRPASSAADKNALSADHLTYSNLENRSEASSSGYGLSVGIGADGKPSLPTPSVGQPAKEEDSGRALATLTPGTLTLDDQTQDLSGLNTDLGRANTTVTPYDIDRLKARQESAAALSELLNGLTGDLSARLNFKEGSPEKTALHAAVGAVVAKLAGGDIAAGAAAGAASEIANGVLQEVLKANPNLSDADSKAITQWVAVMVGAAVGGETGAATGLDNVNHNYLDHYESLAREKAKQQLAQCQSKGSCSESDIAALQKEVSYWDGLDEQRDDHLKSACDADPKGSACIAAVTDALKAIEYLRDSADPLKPSSILPGGYTDMAMRLKDGRFGGISNQELAAAVYAERTQTIELLGNYGDSVQAALREEARNGLINSAVAVLTFAVAEKVARNGGGTGSAGQGELSGKGGIVAEYNPLNKGPLPDEIVNTFRSGTYREVVTTEPTTLYRVISDNGNPAGGYWTRTKPSGPVQSVIDSALDQNWGNTATRVVEMEVPTGTRIFEGIAAPQRGLVGGGNQIYFDKALNPLDRSWIK